MSEPVLIVEFCRNDGEVTKQIVRSIRLNGEPKPMTGKRALLSAIGMLIEGRMLRAGDRLTVRLPVEGEDV